MFGELGLHGLLAYDGSMEAGHCWPLEDCGRDS
jgi:hypothetical protein